VGGRRAAAAAEAARGLASSSEELTFGTVALTATRTPGGHAGTEASGRPRPVGERVSGGVTVPARTSGGGTARLNFEADAVDTIAFIFSAGAALATLGTATGAFDVDTLPVMVMVGQPKKCFGRLNEVHSLKV